MFWNLRIITFYLIITIISLLCFILFCIPFSLVSINYSTKYKLAQVYSFIFIKLAQFICGIRYKVIGLEKLPQKPYLVIANHQSFWENFFMQIIIPEHSWVIKQELFNIPLFGKGLRMLKPIAIDRNYHNSVKKILTEGTKIINQGLSLVIFPESTRIPVGKNIKFKASASKLAIEAKTPMVLLVHNSGNVWPKGFWFKKPGMVTVKVIEVIPVEEILSYQVRELNEYIESRIHEEKNMLSVN